MSRILKNNNEAKFQALANSNGWSASKRGWPDFICFNQTTGEVIAVEVKPRTKTGARLRRLKRQQADCLDALKSAGIRCFVSDGDTLEPYDRNRHYNDKRRSRPQKA